MTKSGLKKLLIIAVIVIAAIPLSFLIYKAYVLKQAEKNVGTIDIDVLIYENADAGVTDIHSLKVSKMYYMQDMILEELEEEEVKKYCLFNDKYCTSYTTDLDSIEYLAKQNLELKTIGAIPLNDTIPNYFNKKLMNDTILDDIAYKRFAIRNPNEYTVFYVQDNLNIPYSFNKLAEKDFKGTITRIDSYKLQEDLFISVTLKVDKKIKKSYFNTLNTNYFKFSKL